MQDMTDAEIVQAIWDLSTRCLSMVKQKRRTIHERPGQVLGAQGARAGRHDEFAKRSLQADEVGVNGSIVRGQGGFLLGGALIGSDVDQLDNLFGCCAAQQYRRL